MNLPSSQAGGTDFSWQPKVQQLKFWFPHRSSQVEEVTASTSSAVADVSCLGRFSLPA